MSGNISDYHFQDMMNLSSTMLRKEWHSRGPTISFFQQFVYELRHASQFSYNDAGVVVFVTALFTIHRYFYTAAILKPVSRYFSFTSKEETKFNESNCKFIYYSLFFTYEYYLVNYQYQEFMTDVATQWEGWFQEMPVPDDILYLYLFEAGFYFHSIYATIFMDSWKKDSIAMLIHHALANSLILFSLAVRYHRIGLVVLYLHDIADVFLEGTKIVTAFKSRKPSFILETLSVVGFLSFTASWFYCRLYIYPQTVLFSAAYVTHTVLPNVVFYFFFNVLLWVLCILNVYWATFLVALIIRIATGQVREVEDTREYEEHEIKGARDENGSTQGYKEGANLRNGVKSNEEATRLRKTN